MMSRSKEKSKKITSSENLKGPDFDSGLSIDSGMGLSGPIHSGDIDSGAIDSGGGVDSVPISPKREVKEWTDTTLDSGCRLDSGLSIQTQAEEKEFNLSDYQDIDGDIPLHLAIVGRDQELALNIINNCPYYLNVLNNLYQSPLHLAILTQQPALIRRLVVAGALCDLQDHRGNTPLHWACSLGNYECLRPLLVAATQAELTGLTFTPSPGLYKFRPQTANMRNYDGATPLHLATDYKLMAVIIKCGVDVNIQEGKSGETVLHTSVCKQRLQSVQLLSRSKSVNLEAKNYARKTALEMALLIERYKPNDATATSIVRILRDERNRRRVESGGLESQGEEEEYVETEESSDDSDVE